MSAAGSPMNRVIQTISAGAATGVSTGKYDFGFLPKALTLFYSTTGAPTAIVGGQMEYSYDGTNWNNFGTAQTAATATVTGAANAATPLPLARYWRFVYTSITGGTTPTLNAWLAGSQ